MTNGRSQRFWQFLDYKRFFFENPRIYHDMKGTGAIPIIGGTDFSDRIAQKSKNVLFREHILTMND